MDLLVILICSFGLALLGFIIPGHVPVVLGLVFVMFFPGYALLAVVFPQKRDLSAFERLTLSVAFSFVMVSLIGIALNYSPWGIQLYSSMVAQLLLISVMVAIAWYRRRKFAAGERSVTGLSHLVSWLSSFLTATGKLDRSLNILLLLAVVAAIGTLGYAFWEPKIGERYTEFYLLGPEGKAVNYPDKPVAGQETDLVVGIINREYQEVDYWLDIDIDRQRMSSVGPIVLNHDGIWQQEVRFNPPRAGPHQKVELSLRKGGETEAYRSIYFWVDVVN